MSNTWQFGGVPEYYLYSGTPPTKLATLNDMNW
jgi:hypothetical protein